MKKVWKIIGIIVGVIVVLLGGLVAWLAWEGSPKEIVAVADEFKPDSSWKLTSENIIPPRNYCIDVRCPSIQRVWQTSKVVTVNVLRNRLNASGWEEVNLKECMPDPKRVDNRSVCQVGREKNGYYASLFIESDTKKDASTIILNIDKK